MVSVGMLHHYAHAASLTKQDKAFSHIFFKAASKLQNINRILNLIIIILCHFTNNLLTFQH